MMNLCMLVWLIIFGSFSYMFIGCTETSFPKELMVKFFFEGKKVCIIKKESIILLCGLLVACYRLYPF